MPKEVYRKFILIFWVFSALVDKKLNIFKASTGKTHGIRFKINPPRNANPIIRTKDSPVVLVIPNLGIENSTSSLFDKPKVLSAIVKVIFSAMELFVVSISNGISALRVD